MSTYRVTQLTDTWTPSGSITGYKLKAGDTYESTEIRMVREKSMRLIVGTNYCVPTSISVLVVTEPDPDPDPPPTDPPPAAGTYTATLVDDETGEVWSGILTKK